MNLDPNALLLLIQNQFASIVGLQRENTELKERIARLEERGIDADPSD